MILRYIPCLSLRDKPTEDAMASAVQPLVMLVGSALGHSAAFLQHPEP